MNNSEKINEGLDRLYGGGKKEITLEEVIKIIESHKEDEEHGYCDTGEDMEYACRSRCMGLAVKRLKEFYK